jgi:hypothetical protein
MLECQRQFGVERGNRMSAMVQRVTGTPCPGRQGGQCILEAKPAAEASDESLTEPEVAPQL